MNLTRVRATIVAGILASSMVLPGVTAMAKDATTGAVTGQPQIKKTVTVADGVTSIPSTDSTLTFTVNQTGNASGNVAGNIQQGAQLITGKPVTIDVGDLSTGVTNNTKEFAEEILSKAGINLTDVGEYTFEIKEATANLNRVGTTSSFGWSVVDTNTYYLRVLIKNDPDADGGKSTLYFITDSNDKDEYADNADHKKDAAAFANTYNKKSTTIDESGKTVSNTLTVTKNVENPQYVSSSNEYTIKVTVQLPTTQKDENGNYVIANGDYVATIQNQVSGCTGDKVTAGNLNTTNGTIEYTAVLHAGESIQISDLAVGAKYTVAEQNVSNMMASMNLAGVDYKLESGNSIKSTDETSTQQTFGENSATVTVTNTFKNVTATGVVTDIAPYLTLILVAGAGVAGYMVLKGRMAR